ncbi:MAG TPA: ElyC/SanA/YdcF family protein [Roseiflexaceae bacterium]|nr:ElyC/SanA/YdcF family protein [Roseiflexaceae bacterium]
MTRLPFRIRLALLTLVAPLLLVAPAIYVVVATSSYRYDDLAAIPPVRVAIVFGAGLRRDGRPSPMLADRVRAAAQLYQLGQVQKILMTGDNSRVEYDEVSAMRRYAVELGVPSDDITLDYAGFSTYESCYRASVIFGVRQAVLITQRYHLPRAVYTCRDLGIEAFGLGAPDWGTYGVGVMLPYTSREALATIKALWQVHIVRPPPTFLGPFEGIAGID